MKTLEKYRLIKAALHWSKDIQRDILTPDQRYPVSYATGEFGELVDAVKKMDMPNIKEEIADSLYAPQMIIAQRTGLNLPIIGADASVKKFYDRRGVWDKIFQQHNATMNNAYLNNGSNYKKPAKVVAALNNAGIQITEEDAAKTLNDLGIEPEEGTGFSKKELTNK